MQLFVYLRSVEQTRGLELGHSGQKREMGTAGSVAESKKTKIEDFLKWKCREGSKDVLSSYYQSVFFFSMLSSHTEKDHLKVRQGTLNKDSLVFSSVCTVCSKNSKKLDARRPGLPKINHYLVFLDSIPHIIKGMRLDEV